MNLASAIFIRFSGSLPAEGEADGTTRIPPAIDRRLIAGDRDERLLPGNFMISLFIEAVRNANDACRQPQAACFSERSLPSAAACMLFLATEA